MKKLIQPFLQIVFILILVASPTIQAQLYLVGDATPGGWDLASQTEMDSVSENMYSWTGTLTSGNFKIKTYSAEDFCGGNWIHPTEGSAPIESASVEILPGCDDNNPDNQWLISADSSVTIVVDLADSTISFSEAQVVQDPMLFVVGDATPGGWDLASQTELTHEGDSLFSWSGLLTSGSFKFKTYAGQDFCGGNWVHPTVASAPVVNASIEILMGCDEANSDNQWSVSADTSVTITVDLKNTTITFAEYANGDTTTTEKPSQVAYLVGSATPGGWNLAAQTAMTQSEADTNIFIYSDTLNAGEFKIKLYEAEDFCAGDWLHPLEAAQDFANTKAAVLSGCGEENPDYKWEVTEPGMYTVTANLYDTTLTVTLDESFNKTINELYLVGDATPGGWDLTAQSAMTQDENDAAVFTWTGTLSAGEMKIKTYAADDFCGGEWIHPITSNAPISSSEIEIKIGCSDSNPDYKWLLTETDAGQYLITVNIDSSSIEFEKQSGTSNEVDGAGITEYKLNQNYPNPFNPSTNISFELPESGLVRLTVYDMLGRKVAGLLNEVITAGSHSINFNAANLSSGMYIYTLETSASVLTRKMMLIK